MTRVVSVYLPKWATDRHRRILGDATPPVDEPLVLSGSDGRRRVVLAANDAGLGLGLYPGTPLAKAQALVPGLRVEDADPNGDIAALERLAFWALRYSPVAAIDAPDGIVLDVEGAAHLMGGEQALAGDLHQRLTAIGYSCRVAIADTWGVAHALARFGSSEVSVAPPGVLQQMIEAMPLSALRLEPAVSAELRALGFESVSDLISVPRAPLALRFGSGIWRRIDQALDVVSEPIDPVRPQDIVEVRRPFAEPIGAAETIKRYIAELVAELCARLETAGDGVRRLDLVCHRVDGLQQAVRVGTAAATRDRKRLTRMLADKVEAIEPGFGIEVMTLAATWAQPLAPVQAMSSLVEPTVADVSDLVDVLANRVGTTRLYRVAPVPSDVPERSVARIAPLAPDGDASWEGRWPRPPRLLPRPEPIDTVALLPDQPPASFTWRGVRRRVKRADGPERIFGEWWARDAELTAVRDYFQVEDDAGGRYWVYRAGDGEDSATGSHRWFLHGIFG